MDPRRPTRRNQVNGARGVVVRRRSAADQGSEMKDRDSVSYRKHVSEVVRNHEYGNSSRRQGLDQVENELCLDTPKAAVGSSMITNLVSRMTARATAIACR